MTREKWTKDPWTVSIATAIFSLLLTIGYDYLKAKPVLSTIWNIVKWVGSFIWTILDFDLKVWGLFVGVFFLSLILFFFSKFQKGDTYKPYFYSYREGHFKKWKWTWSWAWNSGKNAWIISNLKAHCPKCDTPLIQHSSMFELTFDCPRCDFRAYNDQCDEPHKIERIILDDIDRKLSEAKVKL
jgi:hypothetical protein